MSQEIDLVESRYERLEQIPWWNQARLQQARVLVAGAGALGNEILKNLALLGVGRILIVDFDTVEISNLSRSVLFRTTDRGESKAEVAARRLKEINPDIHVLPIKGDLRWEIGLGVYRRMDIVIGGLDSVGARLGLNELCWKANVPWIDGGMNELSGIVRVFVPPEGACFECNLSDQDYQQLNLRYSCQLLPRQDVVEGHTPTTPTIASVVAAWQVQEAIKWLHDKPVAASQGISYNGLTHNFFIVNYQRQEGCLAHETLEDIIPLPEASSQMSVEDLLSLLHQRLGEDVTVELDREIVYRMSCPRCTTHTTVVQPIFRLSQRDSLCPHCHTERNLQMTHYLDGSDLFAKRSLSSLGIPPLHIMMAKGKKGQTWHVELTGDARNGSLAEFLGGNERYEHS